MLQAIERISKSRDRLVRESSAQLAIELFDATQESVKRLFSGLAQLHELNAPIVRSATSYDQAFLVHPIQVMSQRRTFDADRFRQVALGGVLLAVQGDEYEPQRQRAAHLCQCSVKSTTHPTRGSRELESNGVRSFGHAP